MEMKIVSMKCSQKQVFWIKGVGKCVVKIFKNRYEVVYS